MREGTAGIVLLAAIIGLPAAFFTIALPAQMRDGGASLAEIGLVWVVWLPSALKWTWAPWLERLALSARVRTRAIAALAVALALGFLPVAVLAERMATGPLVLLAVLCAALALSIQLLYAGWAMRFLDEDQRGRANGFAAGGMVLGGIIGGGLIPWAAGLLGWWAVVLATSTVMVLAGFAGVLLRDQEGVPAAVPDAAFKEGISVLRRGPLVVCLVLIAMASGADVTLPARLVDAGIAPDQAALLLGSLATALIVPVSLLSGWLVSKVGVGPCALVCAVLKGAVLLALAVSPAGAGTQVATLSVIDFVLAGAFTVLTWQFYMQQAKGRVPVAAYAVLTSLDALIRFVGAICAGLLAQAAGYASLFGLAAVVTLGAGVAVAWVGGRQVRHASVYIEKVDADNDEGGLDVNASR